AIKRIVDALRFDLGRCKGRLHPSSQMVLPDLDNIAILECGSEMSDETRRIRIARIYFISDLRCKGPDRGVRSPCLCKLCKSSLAVEKSGGHAKRCAELCGIGRRRILLDFKRFPKPVHGSLRCLANDLRDVIGPYTFPGERYSAVDKR